MVRDRATRDRSRCRARRALGGGLAALVVLSVVGATVGAGTLVLSQVGSDLDQTATTTGEVVRTDDYAAGDDWAVDARYRYAVDGRTYEAWTEPAWGQVGSWSAVEAYRDRETVDVHYDPGEPGDASVGGTSPGEVLLSESAAKLAYLLTVVYALAPVLLVFALTPLAGHPRVDRVRDRLRTGAAVGTAVLLAAIAVGVVGSAVGTGAELAADNREATTARGTVVAVDYHERTGLDRLHVATDDGEGLDGLDARIEDRQWVVEVEYRYVDEGVTYRGETLYSDGSGTVDSERAARQFVRRHPPGSTVAVYHGPDHPEAFDGPFLRRADPAREVVDTLLFGAVLGVAVGWVVRRVGRRAVGSSIRRRLRRRLLAGGREG